VRVRADRVTSILVLCGTSIALCGCLAPRAKAISSHRNERPSPRDEPLAEEKLVFTMKPTPVEYPTVVSVAHNAPTDGVTLPFTIEIDASGTADATAKAWLEGESGEAVTEIALHWETEAARYSGTKVLSSSDVLAPGSYVVRASMTKGDRASNVRDAPVAVIVKPPAPEPVEVLPLGTEEVTAHFDKNSYIVSGEDDAKFQALASRIRKQRPLIRLVLIEGHCDRRGTEDYNLALGFLRANTLARMLAPFLPGVEIVPTSLGSSKPDPDSDGEDAYSLNRWARLRIP
jgi:outer membrane protein OmpA-like peptidoglycan-associated protein